MSDEAARRLQVRAEMPIIDGARAPLRDLQRHAPARGLWLYFWLRVLRPLLVTALWLLAVRYGWSRLFGAPEQMPLWQQGVLYVAAIGMIALLMVALARRRRREVAAESPSEYPDSTSEEISSFLNVSPQELEQWQQAQRLVVHHDEEGMVERAEDTARMPRDPDSR